MTFDQEFLQDLKRVREDVGPKCELLFPGPPFAYRQDALGLTSR